MLKQNELKPIQISFKDCDSYRTAYTQAVLTEYKYDKDQRAKCKLEDVIFRRKSPNLLVFKIPSSYSGPPFEYTEGELVDLRPNSTDTKIQAIVRKSVDGKSRSRVNNMSHFHYQLFLHMSMQLKISFHYSV